MADIEIRQASPTAFYIKVHDTDNVAIIVNDNGLKAGTRFPDGLELIEHIPQGHKVALVDIPANSEIVRYGEVIGYAVRSIPQGSWVEESLVALPEAKAVGSVSMSLLGGDEAPGVMLFSSRDPQHYQQGQGTQLVQEIASMLPGLLERWIERA